MEVLKRLRSWSDDVGCWLEDQKENRKRQRATDEEHAPKAKRADIVDDGLDLNAVGGECMDLTGSNPAARPWAPPCFRHRFDGLLGPTR